MRDVSWMHDASCLMQAIATVALDDDFLGSLSLNESLVRFQGSASSPNAFDDPPAALFSSLLLGR